MRYYEDVPQYPWGLWIAIFLVVFVVAPVFCVLAINGYSLR